MTSLFCAGFAHPSRKYANSQNSRMKETDYDGVGLSIILQKLFWLNIIQYLSKCADVWIKQKGRREKAGMGSVLNSLHFTTSD